MSNFTFTRHETDRYELQQLKTPFSFLLVRKADNSSAYFQGDDADLWDHNMTAIEGIKTWNAGNTLDKSFDFLCSGYDEVLS